MPNVDERDRSFVWMSKQPLPSDEQFFQLFPHGCNIINRHYTTWKDSIGRNKQTPFVQYRCELTPDEYGLRMVGHKASIVSYPSAVTRGVSYSAEQKYDRHMERRGRDTWLCEFTKGDNTVISCD